MRSKDAGGARAVRAQQEQQRERKRGCTAVWLAQGLVEVSIPGLLGAVVHATFGVVPVLRDILVTVSH